jgi:hypothetical protein
VFVSPKSSRSFETRARFMAARRNNFRRFHVSR